SYGEALAQVGGLEKLETFRELGNSLMEKYGVSREMAEVLPTNRHSRSTKLNYQKYVNDLGELLIRCIEQKVREIASQTKGKNCEPPIKSRYRLTDIVRDTIIYESMDDMYEGLKFMDAACEARKQD
ncbi:Ankrd17, partial [Symbiodinium necroappetens]